MDAIAPYLFFWNTWVIFPAFLVAAAWAYWKYRKNSLAVLATGLVLFLVAEGLRAAFPCTFASSSCGQSGHRCGCFYRGAGGCRMVCVERLSWVQACNLTARC